MASCKRGDIVQLLRKGFYIVDSPFVPASEFTGRPLPLTLIFIPDGHSKVMNTGVHTQVAVPKVRWTKA